MPRFVYPIDSSNIFIKFGFRANEYVKIKHCLKFRSFNGFKNRKI